MGRFTHEACAVDTDREVVYLTEDAPDGRLYFSSQRGTSGSSGGGSTYEVAGPFHR
jgi:secreted PhoX family phosphatase